MVRKRGSDNVFERNSKRAARTVPTTPTLSSEDRENPLNTGLLNLYKNEINKLTDTTPTQNVGDFGNENSSIVKQETKNVETSKPPALAKKVKKSNLALTLKHSSINFDAVGGIDDILEELLDMCMHLKILNLYKRCKVSPVRGILLHGPPGCGKTHLVHALAGELEIPYIEVAATELVCGISGESESKIRETFDEAVKNGRCILFIDEIDAICPKREHANGGMEKRMVTQMLKCLDELREKDVESNVIVIGATNVPDSIDPVLRRGGRFDREIAIGIPNEESRLKILQILCAEFNLTPEFDLDWIAHNTPGFVGADLQTLVSKALENGMKRIREGLKESAGISREKGTTRLNSVRTWFKSLFIPDEDLVKYNFTLEDFQTALKDIVPYCKREGFASVPNVRWDDIGALVDVKKKLQRTILQTVKLRKFYEGQKLSTSKGILLHGPKGCGKTLLAKAIANECNINFLSVNGPELLSMYLGESEKAVRKCFERARHSAPCIIFFDEFDALCPSRSNTSNTNAAAERVVNQLLSEMDGIQERKQVFVIAATNRIEKIDSAMLRPGRLDKVIFVDLPSPSGRKDILKSLTKNKTQPKIDEDLSLDAIAFDERCNEFSGADLAYLVREAIQNAVDEHESQSLDTGLILNQSHFEQAFIDVQPSFNEQDRKHYKKYRKSP